MATMPKTFRPPHAPTRQERGREHDARRADQPSRAWYKTRAWQNRRAMQLVEHPLCQRCEARGVITSATVANHNPPHGDDYERFFWGPLESTCKPCHDGEIQREEVQQRRRARHEQA